jgi:hypothetical protein
MAGLLRFAHEITANPFSKPYFPEILKNLCIPRLLHETGKQR